MKCRIFYIFLIAFFFFALGITVGFGYTIEKELSTSYGSIIYVNHLYEQEEGPSLLEISSDIDMIIQKNGYKGWTHNQVERLAILLKKGQKEFGINYKDMLSIIEIESSFKKYAINRNDGTSTDYGLCQVNSRNWKDLSVKAEEVLKKWKNDYVDSTYDMGLNVVCCMLYLDWSRNHLKSKGEYTHSRWIQSYNVGINGSKSPKTFYQKRRTRYYEKFIIAKNIF